MADQNPPSARTPSGRNRTLISAAVAVTVALAIGFGAGYTVGNFENSDDRTPAAPATQQTSVEPEAIETTPPPASERPENVTPTTMTYSFNDEEEARWSLG